MEKYFVYQHINRVNGKRYIGITRQSTPEARWGSNGANYSSTPHFFNAIRKYGWDNFLHEVLFSDLSKEEACEIERRLIQEYKTQDKEFGYNVTEGGDAPLMPLEIRKRLSKALMGNKNGLGKPCSPEKRKKISEANKGKKFSLERRIKMSLAKKGKTHATISDEAKKKISDSHKKKPVYCPELNKTFPSIQGCAKELKIEATRICASCKGRVKSVCGMHFMYVDDIEMPNDHLHKTESTSKRVEIAAPCHQGEDMV